MCARIFYGSYNAVAMHRIVMCKSSGDKHIHSSAWAGSGSRRCFMEMISLALQGAAWLQFCLSPARGCWQRNLPPPTPGAMRTSLVLLWAVGALQGAEQSPFGKVRASQLGHKCHSRVRSCSKSKIIFLLSHWKICPAKVESPITWCWTLMWSEGTGVKGETFLVLEELLRGRITSYLGCL